MIWTNLHQNQTCINGMFGSALARQISRLNACWTWNSQSYIINLLCCRSISPQFCTNERGSKRMLILHKKSETLVRRWRITWNEFATFKKHTITCIDEFGHWFEINRLTLHFVLFFSSHYTFTNHFTIIFTINLR